MDMQTVRENMAIERVNNAKPAMVTVEAEAILPGGLREEARVYLADATAYIVSCEATGNRLTADGRVNFHAIYAQGDLNKLSSADTSASFAQQLALTGENNGNVADVRSSAAVQQVSARVFNGRLLLKALVQINAQTVIGENVSVLAKIENAPLAQTRETTVKSAQIVGRGETENLLKEEIPLAAQLGIAETLYGQANLLVEDITGGADGKVGVSGRINLEVYHMGKDENHPLIITKHTVPFEQTVILTGALGDAVSASSNVYDVAVASKENNDGGRTMRVEVLAHTKIAAVQDASQNVLTDVYMTDGASVEPVLATLPTTTEVIDTHTAESGKTVIMLPEGSPRISQPLTAHVRPVILDSKKENDRLVLDGVLACDLIYKTDDQTAPVSVQVEEPFSVALKTEARPEDILTVDISDAEMNAITGDRAEIKYILHLTANGVRQTSGSYVTELIEKPALAMEPGIDLYFVQPGESAWELAKRAKVSVETLKALNPNLKDQPAAGETVITYRQ